MFNRPFWAQSPLEASRRTQYAGSWYEGNGEKLKLQLKDYLENAHSIPDKSSCARLHSQNKDFTQPILAIISPHAGYMYSGQTAAFAYKAASKQNNIKRVFLLGPSHHIAIKGAALPQNNSFATPLGDIELDTDTLVELKSYPMFSVHNNVHQIEHSLELQLPFIKYCFPNAKLIPIVIGHLDDDSEVRLIGEILKGFVGKDDLVVVSSDFTHYGPRYSYTPFPSYSSEKIAGLDGEAFQHLSKLDLDGFIEFLHRTNDTICGMYPCQVLMSMLPHDSHGTAVQYANSQDIAKDDSENSVSYIGMVFSGAQWPAEPGRVRPTKDIVKLSASERQALLNLARKTIEVFVREHRTATPAELGVTITPAMKACFGVFVTLTIKPPGKEHDHDHDGLRGCIGSIYPVKPLWKAVQDNAIGACSRDHRFEPVREFELSQLTLDINVLTPPRRVASYNDIVIGRDGVILTKNKHQAVFLPQVAVEWKWDLNQLLTQLAQKAGLHRDDWRDGCKFDIFQSEEIR